VVNAQHPASSAPLSPTSEGGKRALPLVPGRTFPALTSGEEELRQQRGVMDQHPKQRAVPTSPTCPDPEHWVAAVPRDEGWKVAKIGALLVHLHTHGCPAQK